MTVVINGGIATLAEAKRHLEFVDGVMLGRAAYQNPGLLIEVDAQIFGTENRFADAFEAAEAMREPLTRMARQGIPVQRLTRHLLGLFQGVPGARAYRRILATEAARPGAGPEVLDRALACVARGAVPGGSLHCAVA